ncbi:MAG: hypothetical protein EOP10_01900 [Proteobacteria bacterium]|nr:MAG: hypothetical protein EOP10_01900 [Pseudomonadota bacterium]
MKMILLSASLFTLAMTLGCAETKFNATETKSLATPATADQKPEPKPVPDTVLEEKKSCEPTDIVKNSFPAAVNECYSSGRVWNYGTNSCVQIRAAAFECKWENVQKELKSIGLSSKAIDEAYTSGKGKLVGCGQSTDKNRIVVQWINVEKSEDGCSNVSTGDVVTGCFTNYGAAPAPGPAKNKEEQDARVYACMNNL